MLKILLRKQFRELLNSFAKSRDGKPRKKAASIGYVLLFVYLGLCFGFMFAMMCVEICDVFHELGLDWAYFGLAGIAASVIGILGSIFTAYSAMYNAKDNDLLLSMPIKPSIIMTARLLTIYLLALVFELLAFLPAIIVHQIMTGFDLPVLLLALLTYLCLSFVIFAVIMLIAWLVAKLAARIKFKSIAVTVLFVLFFVAYYYFCFNMSDILVELVGNALFIGEGMQSTWNPFYHIGMAITGNIGSLLIVIAGTAVIFGACYYICARSFLVIITTDRGRAKKVFKDETQKSGAAFGALLKREFIHIGKTPMYLLNAAISTIAMPILTVVIVVKSDFATDMVQYFTFGGDMGAIPLLVVICGICAFISSINLISEASVSIEGSKYLWTLKTAPVPTISILNSKLALHILLTLIPALIFVAVASVIVGLGVGPVMIGILFIVGVVLLQAVFGLFLNLRHPKLEWTSEVVAVKQSMAVGLGMLCNVLFVVAIMLVYFIWLSDVLSSEIYILIAAAVCFLAAFVIYRWIRTRGVAIFEEL